MDIVRTRRRSRWRRPILGVMGAALVVAGAWGSLHLRRAAPSVDRGSVWIDTVSRGPMTREVLGQGTLVPEEVHWIPARTAARVAEVLVKVGEAVQPDSIIVKLGNRDLELAQLEARQQLAQGEAQLTNLQAALNAQKLAQQSIVASLGTDLGEARRRAQADEELGKRGFLSELEQRQSRDRAGELTGRLEFERQRLAAQSQGFAAQLAAERVRIEGLRSVVQFRQRDVQELEVRAGATGVVQELPLQPGQAISAGAVLAKIVRLDRLKAEIRVPEVEARDLRVGQQASIDTRNGIMPGHVARVDPAAQSGTVRVDVGLDGPLPPGARPDLNVEGTIEMERLPDVLQVGRPVSGHAGGRAGLFRLDPGGDFAQRVSVGLGRMSVKTIEVRDGLRAGDRVILSDTSRWDHVDRIRLE